MPDERGDDLFLHPVRRLRQLLGDGKITPEEFASKLFDHLAHDRRTSAHLAERMLALVPESGKPIFVERVDEALRPGFSRHPFKYGGAEPVPEGRLRREGEEQTARVRAWAAEFRRLMYLDEAGDGATGDH